MSAPGSPRIRMRPIGPAIADAQATARRAAAWRAGSRRDRRAWFSRVWKIGQPLSRNSGKQRGDGRHDRTHRREIVAERLAEAAGFEKIALHVDDDQRDMLGIEREGEGSAATSIMAPPRAATRVAPGQSGIHVTRKPRRAIRRRWRDVRAAAGARSSRRSTHVNAPPCAGRWSCGRPAAGVS